MADTYDSPWKEILERFFPEFLELLFPQAHRDIDWSKGFESLDKELAKVVRDAAAGDRVADKLLKVWRLDGSPLGVLIHLELQNRVERRFAARMFTYNYRIFDRYQLPVASFVVLGDDHPEWRPQRFGWSLWGCELHFRFPAIKLIDFQGARKELRASANPLALIVEAHLDTRETRHAPRERLRRKLALARRLVTRGLERTQVLELLRCLDWLLSLPPALDRQFWEDHQRLEETLNVRYMTSVERLGMEKGLAQGKEQGLQQGAARMVGRILERRFGPVPAETRERLRKASPDQLEEWADRSLEAEALEEVFASDDNT